MFRYIISINPLGFLYGSRGRFLSPENLVGRSGAAFPPLAVAITGLFAHRESMALKDSNFAVAGPFWAYDNDLQNFFVPTPFHLLVEGNKVVHRLVWNGTKWVDSEGAKISGKFTENTWLPIKQWQNPQTVEAAPWKFIPHLHPRLAEEERTVRQDNEEGSLFLENAVQMPPNCRLIYLATDRLDNGWYRFGGEGHLVNVECVEISAAVQAILDRPVGGNFALITAAVWGSNRQSLRYPEEWERKLEALLTARPIPFRYRLGGRLSRGHYATPPGTVYVLNEGLESWYAWDENIFPKSAYSYKRWGCGLALAV
ncbi:MAG: type III-B CRISPR module-associated Cmr3 family protein [Pseudanabaenaceae cyanobacterium SKYGB_i_bin29]|nr:type III-B CRISPR module-associated protein Cmr3 [Pseudanabaenaceae cyanobacterium SKYG29]MDW8420439.1 type III-B CRISPR module-associated Cmr3 family protein [Pseudanabaenaceae cyanobacterium SKYGB_i_bin29]